MGLDLSLYKNGKEICYGRKAWTLFEFFRTADEISEYECRVPLSRIKEFVNLLKDDEDFLESICGRGDLSEEEYEKCETICSKVAFDECCQLGADWEASAYYCWYEALKGEEEEEAEYILDASW